MCREFTQIIKRVLRLPVACLLVNRYLHRLRVIEKNPWRDVRGALRFRELSLEPLHNLRSQVLVEIWVELGLGVGLPQLFRSKYRLCRGQQRVAGASLLVLLRTSEWNSLRIYEIPMEFYFIVTAAISSGHMFSI